MSNDSCIRKLHEACKAMLEWLALSCKEKDCDGYYYIIGGLASYRKHLAEIEECFDAAVKAGAADEATSRIADIGLLRVKGTLPADKLWTDDCITIHPDNIDALRRGTELLRLQLDSLAEPEKTARHLLKGEESSAGAAGKGEAADGLFIDPEARSASWNGACLQINQHADFVMLSTLHNSAGEVVLYADLLNILKPGEVDESVPMTEAPQELKDAASNIRKAFRSAACPLDVKAVRGIGYQLIDK